MSFPCFSIRFLGLAVLGRKPWEQKMCCFIDSLRVHAFLLLHDHIVLVLVLALMPVLVVPVLVLVRC